MNLFSPSRKVTQAAPQPAAALRVQSSVQGMARALGWGLARIAGNLIGFWNFTATAITESPQGGKGGGGGGAVTTGYSYTCTVEIGLCEGTIRGIRQAWSNKTPEDLVTQGFAAFSGSPTQFPWGWSPPSLSWEQVFAYLLGGTPLPVTTSGGAPTFAQAYRGLAYVANANFGLGTDPSLPNLTFEVAFGIGAAVTETATVPASGPYTIAAAYYDVTANGASEAIAVPFAAPSTYVCQNPKGVPFTQSGIVALESTYAFGSSSSGIYYTDTDPPSFLTHVSGTPSAGEYSFSNYTITFAAADAGKAVTVVDLAVSPGVFYGSIVTGDLVAGSRNVGSLSGITGLPPGAAVSGSGVAPGTVIAGLSGGTGTGAVSAGSATVTLSGGTFVAAPGTGIIDSDALFPPGTSVSSYSGPYFATLSASAAGTGWETLVFTTMPTAASDAVYPGAGTVGSITLSSGTGVLVGAIMSIDVWSYPVNDIATVATVAGDVISFQLTDAALGAGYPPLIIGQPISFATSSTGHLSAGSDVINGLTFAPATGASVTDPLGYLPADGSATVSGAAPSSLVLSADATGSSAADVITFLSELVLSLPATATVPGTSLTVTGAALQQVAGSAPTSSGQFTLTPQGLYTFSSADAGKTVVIVDVPDANPADVVADFLTNPTYGVPLFAPARLGDLSIFRAWCQASGLFVSPVLTSQQQATQLLQDLMTATNSAAVWSGGKLTVVPYGDAALTGNGASYTPPAAPLYSLDDDDFLANEATNSASVSASSSPDPVTVTRLDPADQVNDVQVEYLDRAQDYNPVIAEAQDDALINLYGLKPSGSKQLHCLCERKAAMLSAQLQLGRQQIRNLYSFTVGREFILLDPMDIVAITDAGIGARNQWVRIREITENMDRSLSIVAEDYLAGTGAAPRYGHQAGAGYRPNFNADPGAALAPVFMDVPAELVQALGCEGWLATNGGALWGGCEVWQSSDDANYSYAGTLQGGSVMGTLTASFGSGSDPDTTDTCAVDLTESRGALLPGTAADADAGNTVCFVCDPDGSNGEYFSYEQAVLTSQYHYDLGKHGASAGYLRRGLYGSAIAAHAAGSLFVRLKPNAVFKLPFAKGQIGNTIHVKLLSFNIWGGGRQTLDQATSYAHTIGGNAPALSSVGALGLYTDLDVGAATNLVSGAGAPGGVSSAGTGMGAGIALTIGGAVLVSASGSFGPGMGSPAATKVTLSITRTNLSGTTTIYAGTAFSLPASDTVPFSITVADTPAAGSNAYEVVGTADQGIAPYSATYLAVSELRR